MSNRCSVFSADSRLVFLNIRNSQLNNGQWSSASPHLHEHKHTDSNSSLFTDWAATEKKKKKNRVPQVHRPSLLRQPPPLKALKKKKKEAPPFHKLLFVFERGEKRVLPSPERRRKHTQRSATYRRKLRRAGKRKTSSLRNLSYPFHSCFYFITSPHEFKLPRRQRPSTTAADIK